MAGLSKADAESRFGHSIRVKELARREAVAEFCSRLGDAADCRSAEFDVKVNEFFW
jgi:hypothetical protein